MNKRIVKGLLTAIISFSIFFVTCDTKMGFGDPIDFIAPELTLDPVGHPYYAQSNAVLTGTVTDNIRVDRVILRDTENGETLFTAELLPNNRWRMVLNFTDADNQRHIIAEIVAYDHVGNSDSNSIVPITIIVDTGKPSVRDIIIKRSDTRTFDLTDYPSLLALETDDSDREDSLNSNAYQNGRFWINALMIEEETRIDNLSLFLYDSRYTDEDDFVKEFTAGDLVAGTSVYAPSWLLDENDIIEAGRQKFGESYKTEYEAGARYYYLVTVKVEDRSENINLITNQQQGFFVLWKRSDDPVGVVDRVAVGNVTPITVTRGSTIPVIFFDDDKLDLAFAGLFTEKQWGGTEQINTGVFITGADDDEKLDNLRAKLFAGEEIYDWTFINRAGRPADQRKITEQIGGRDLEEFVYYVQTGNEDSDYGAFVLVTFAQDRKTNPNDTSSSNQNFYQRKYIVNVIDENAPLIVFDTAGELMQEDPIKFPFNEISPEENTFPVLEDGRYFTIYGYTLRENSSTINSVKVFRFAWIPYNMPGGMDSHVEAVQIALENGTGFPQGVQHWDLSSEFTNQPVVDKPIPPGVPGIDPPYRWQYFSKKFDVLGGEDDIHGLDRGYKNFVYDDGSPDGIFENETKLFVFYAEDNMGHAVFRQIRLLGNKTPPTIRIFDLTGRESLADITPPYIFNFDTNTDGSIDEDEREAYEDELRNFQDTVSERIQNAAMPGGVLADNLDETQSSQTYPLGMTLKFWALAEREGGIGIRDIKMQDITFASDTPHTGSTFTAGVSRGISYTENLPDVTQRVFLFTATDALGNERQVQRTVTVTNIASLTNITTVSQSGRYGIFENITDTPNNRIEIKANFSAPIVLEGGRPRLNIRYPLSDGNWVYRAIACEEAPGLTRYTALTFIFDVPEGSGYSDWKLETLYDNSGVFGTRMGTMTFDNPDRDRPISLPQGVRILDAERLTPAFTPSNMVGFSYSWSNETHSLQGRKRIELDGVRPRITLAANGISGKPTYTGTNHRYFRNEEVIEITLQGDEVIRSEAVGGQPARLQFYIRDASGTNQGPFTGLAYTRPGGTNQLVFTVQVNAANTNTDGLLTNVSFASGFGRIVDNVGNRADFSQLASSINSALTATPVYIKRTLPALPPTSFNPTGENRNGVWHLNGQTTITVTASSSRGPDNLNWEDVVEYSFNGGMNWSTYSSTPPITTNNSGQFEVQTRYRDRAGNVSDPPFSRTLNINDTFPRLQSVNASVPAGRHRYPTGTPANDTIRFTLSFADSVRVATPANVSITLTNRNNSNTDKMASTTSSPSFQVVLSPAAGQTTITRTNSSSIFFDWTGIGGTGQIKEMLDGLYVSSITITGLSDSFGNPGGTGSATSSGAGIASLISISGYTVPNLPGGIIIDCIAPTVEARVPAMDAANPGILAGNRNTITLTFSEPVMKGNGTITIRPRGNYAIPAVFENSGYYLSIDGNNRFTRPTANTSFVAGFHDIYNAGGLTVAERNALVQSTNDSWGSLTTNARTGHNIGPYVRTTHGLRPSTATYGGYTGNYGTATGANGPNPAQHEGTASDNNRFLLPDTATKWVLAYQYSDLFATTGDVAAIRNVLTKAKWRWQEIDIATLIDSGANSAFSNNNTTVTIPLNEPLLAGLQWEVYYNAGAFTDLAGNPVARQGSADPSAATATSDYWFWTDGVQTPVIRVNRRSYDARAVGTVDTANAGNHTSLNNLQPSNTSRAYGTPPLDTTNWATNGPRDTGRDGWGINDFNTIHYRISSETPGASLTAGTYRATTAITNRTRSTVNAAFSGSVHTANTNNQITGQNGVNWNTTTATSGTWVLTNLIRRASGTGATGYSVTDNNTGITVTREFAGTYRGLRSYNKDMTISEMNTVALSAFTATNNQGNVTFGALEAGKDYVVAQASVTRTGTATTGTAVNTSNKGYEGVFRTIVALWTTDNTTSTFVEGSNIKNGMPSIAGFPVRDAEETGDNRFIKQFYNVTSGNPGHHYWVSTEIVSEWYFLRWLRQAPNTGSHQQDGEANNYLMVGYGDLTYGYGIGTN